MYYSYYSVDDWYIYVALYVFVMFVFFFFKQKTAYEMRISDWSSDVCSSDLYASEMVSYADLILPDTTYLERHDCISLLDRPICDAEGVADAIRQPVVAPDRDVRPFQDVLIDLGARLGLPGLVNADGGRSEEHTSELQSLMRISYAVFCLKKKRIKCNCKHT